MKSLSYLMIATLFVWGMALPLTGQSELTEEIERLANQYVQKSKNQGLVVGFLSNGQPWVKGFGTTGKDQMAPNAKSLFEIGALTNTFTAFLALEQEYEARYSQTDPVSGYLPDSVQLALYHAIICREITMEAKNPRGERIPIRIRTCKPEPSQSGRSIQFCDLLTHTSGIPNEIINGLDWNPFETVKIKLPNCDPVSLNKFYKRLSRVEMLSEPGLQYFYSQVGMALLGHLISEVAGINYAPLLQEKLLTPLGMDDTRMWLNKAQRLALCQGHNYQGDTICSADFSAMAPAVGLKSNARDLLQFLVANLSEGHDDIANVLAMMKIIRTEKVGEKWGAPVDLASGWMRSPLNKKNKSSLVYWQNGGTAGFRAFMGFVPQSKTAVVVLSNSANSVDDLAYDILQLMNVEN